jgi:hypothetical protein
METLLHAGTQHPDLTLLVLTGVVSFAAGTGAGAYAALTGKLSGLTETESAES